MRTLKQIISEHIEYRKQIIKLAKADLIKTYRGAALRMGMGYYKSSSKNICILVCIFCWIKSRKVCKWLSIFLMACFWINSLVLYEWYDNSRNRVYKKI